MCLPLQSVNVIFVNCEPVSLSDLFIVDARYLISSSWWRQRESGPASVIRHQEKLTIVGLGAMQPYENGGQLWMNASPFAPCQRSWHVSTFLIPTAQRRNNLAAVSPRIRKCFDMSFVAVLKGVPD